MSEAVPFQFPGVVSKQPTKDTVNQTSALAWGNLSEITWVPAESIPASKHIAVPIFTLGPSLTGAWGSWVSGRVGAAT